MQSDPRTTPAITYRSRLLICAQVRLPSYNPGMVPRVVVLVATALLQSPGVVAQAPDNRAHARTTLSAIAAGEFGNVETDFTSQMQKALPPGRLAAMWATLQGQAGAFKSCEAEPRVVRIADKEMVIT